MALIDHAEEMLITIEVGGYALNGFKCVVDEAMSEPDRVYVEITSRVDVDFGPLMEADSTVVVTLGAMESRRFERRLASAAFIHFEDGMLHYGLELRPPFWFLTHSMNTRKFRDMTTEAIVDKVLGEEGVTHKWRTRRPSKSRPFCVQYRETTKAFVERLLEYEGFYYYFEEDGTMVIGDTSSAELMVEGLPLYTLIETGGALTHAEQGVTSITRGASVSSGNATVNDFNFKTPKANIRQTSTSAHDGDLEIYDYPTGYRDPGVGAILAKLRVEALTAEKRYVEGTSNVAQFAAARIFDFGHTEAIDFSGSYLLVRVNHVFETARVGERMKEGRYENQFFAIPSKTPWRPQLKTPRPIVEGNHTAHVRGPAGEEIHTDIYGRAKVQFHWDRESKSTDEDSRWIRTLQETSSSMVVSRVGWEIVVSYIDGDPDRPIGLARNINGKMTPTYGQPARKNIMTIKTESYPGKNGFNEIRLDDSAGAMRMDWHAQRDHHNTVENNKTEKISQNHLHLVKQGLNRVVALNQGVTVGGNENKDVQTYFSESVKGNRTETIGGSEKVNVKVTSSTTVEKNETVSIGSVRFSLVGLGAVGVPSPKYIAQLVVPHTLGVGHDDMLAGGQDDGGANDGRVTGNVESGGAAGPTGAFGGDGTFAGFGDSGGGDSSVAGSRFASLHGAASHLGSSPVAGATSRAVGAASTANGGGASSPAGGGDTVSGIGALISDLAGGSKGLTSIVGQVAGSGPLGQALQGVTSSLTSGSGVQGALSQGLQGAVGAAANNIGGPLGSAVKGIANGIFGGQGVQGSLTQGLQGALGQGIQGALGSGPVGSAVSTLLGGEKGIGDIASSLAKGDFGNALDTGKLGFENAIKGVMTPAGLEAAAGGILGDMFKGSVNKDTRNILTRMIGAAQIVAAGGNINVASNYLFTEIIGGAKISNAIEGSLMQTASKFLVHTVGGMILRKSKDDMSTSAKKTQVRVGGMAKMHSDEKIELRGKVIEIEGQTKVTLKSGDLLIELTPETTTIKGSLKVKSGTNIKISGKPDKLTA